MASNWLKNQAEKLEDDLSRWPDWAVETSGGNASRYDNGASERHESAGSGKNKEE